MKRMIEYKLTKEKVFEHIKEEDILRSAYPLKFLFRKTRFVFLAIVIFAIILSFFAGVAVIILFIAYFAILFVLFLFLRNEIANVALADIAKNMRNLVADPQLQWLNKQKDIINVPSKIGRIGTPNLKEEDYKVLSHLKKNGTGQGLRKVLPQLKDSSSENRKLNRFVTRGYIKKIVNDYEYIPWTFKIINDTSPESRIMEEKITQAWEKVIDEEV